MTNRVLTVAVLALLVLVAAGMAIVRTPGPLPSPSGGVSESLAAERARRVSGLAYDVRLRVPTARNEPIGGEITAHFTMASAGRPLVFDFAQPAERLLSTDVNGRRVEARVVNGHIVIPAESLVRGENTVRFAFLAGEDALNRQDDLLYSLFVPARARTAFPCLDQPDLKARWQLWLDVPPGWSAVSNGREAGRVATSDRVSYLFDQTPPISTYLFAFAAGRFSVESASRNGRTFRMFHRETDEKRITRNRDAIFDQHAQALSWLETYTDIAYPFAKFDFVLIPAFQFSGMEHPGAVFYNANSLLLDDAATQTQQLARANVIAHETAHMWFGNLVTMAWFNDVWMKEVFANFMAAKIVNPAFPTLRHDLRFLVQHYPLAYDLDRTAGANPIRQQLTNLDDAGSLYGAAIYQKAPIVMRQLELLMGPDAFRDGVRQYLTLHGFANATWPDLVRTFDALSTLDIGAWSHGWIDEPGRPVVTTDLRQGDGTITHLSFRQSDVRGRSLQWTQQLEIVLGYDDGVRRFRLVMDGQERELTDARGLPVPNWILPVGGGLGYGKFDLDAGTLAFLRDRAHAIEDPLLRGAAIITLWDAVLDGQVAPSGAWRMLLEAVASESDELDLQLELDVLRTLFWRVAPASVRPALAGELERVLRDGLNRATTTSVKGAWFTTLRSVATTETTREWLEDVWARRSRIDGLPLSEIDESDLAFDLAVRDRVTANTILTTQLARITDADRRARFSFIMPALSNDASVRSGFFETLRDRTNRRHEAWVVDAMRYLHHPLRAQTSAPLVRPALEMTLDIQRTGDIFFPKRWVDATLSGYNTSVVADDVRTFLDSLPADYPTRLRWSLLTSAEPLFRAANLSW